MHLLLLSLEAIERVCGQEISDKSNASRDEKASHSEKCGKERSKSPCFFAARNLRIARRRVRSNLVLTAVPESQRKLVPSNTATFVRSMGARAQHTILPIAVVLRKMEWKNQISAPLRKAKSNQIP
jgi:hypothetical protein